MGRVLVFCLRMRLRIRIPFSLCLSGPNLNWRLELGVGEVVVDGRGGVKMVRELISS